MLWQLDTILQCLIIGLVPWLYIRVYCFCLLEHQVTVTPLPTFSSGVERVLKNSNPGDLPAGYMFKASQEAAEYYLSLFPTIDGYSKAFGNIAQRLYQKYPALEADGFEPWVNMILLISL